MDQQILILWSEGDWRCELYPAPGGAAFLKIFRGEHLVVVESTFVGGLAFKRAEILGRYSVVRRSPSPWINEHVVGRLAHLRAHQLTNYEPQLEDELVTAAGLHC